MGRGACGAWRGPFLHQTFWEVGGWFPSKEVTISKRQSIRAGRRGRRETSMLVGREGVGVARAWGSSSPWPLSTTIVSSCLRQGPLGLPFQNQHRVRLQHKAGAATPLAAAHHLQGEFGTSRAHFVTSERLSTRLCSLRKTKQRLKHPTRLFQGGRFSSGRHKTQGLGATHDLFPVFFLGHDMLGRQGY